MARLLKLPEVAQRLEVSEKTARRYVKAGVLPSVFVGNAYRVNEEDVEEYLRRAKVEIGGNIPKAPAPPPLDSKERRGAGEAAEGDLEAFRKAQEAFGELLRLSGIEPRYITMPHAQLAALYDAASLEEAQAVTASLVAERRALAEHHPDAKFPGGKPTIALQLSILTAMAGMGRVTEREAAAAREAGEEERVRHIHKELDLAKQALADAA